MKRIQIAVVLTVGMRLLVANANAQCDGPLAHSGSSSGSCSGTVASGGCAGPIISIPPYYTCGGNSAENCLTVPASIGTTTPCAQTFDGPAWVAAWAAYNICIEAGLGPFCGDPPTVAQYTACSAGTPTSIPGNVYGGSSGTCAYGMLDNEDSSEKLILLAAISN